MQHCSKCKVNIITNNELCPLCQGTIEKIDDNEKVFPTITPKRKNHLVLKILLVISLIAIISSETINLSLSSSNNWATYVLFGIACFWILTTVFLIKKANILKMIVYETAILAVMATAWDYAIGGKNWSINFVVPILIFASILLLMILIKAMRLNPEEYSIYLFDMTIISLFPIIFYIKDMVTIKLPTLICGALNITVILIFIIFEGEKILIDLKRRFHF